MSSSKNPFLATLPKDATAVKSGNPSRTASGHMRSQSSTAELLSEALKKNASTSDVQEEFSLKDWISMADNLNVQDQKPNQGEEIAENSPFRRGSSTRSIDSDAEIEAFRNHPDDNPDFRDGPAVPAPPTVDRSRKPSTSNEPPPVTRSKKPVARHTRARSMGSALSHIVLEPVERSVQPTLHHTPPRRKKRPSSIAELPTGLNVSFSGLDVDDHDEGDDVQSKVNNLIARNAALKQLNTAMQQELARVKADRLYLEQKLSQVVTDEQK